MKKFIFLLILLSNIFFIYSQNEKNRDVERRPVIYLSYDDAGNQVQRFYCSWDGHCFIPDPPDKTPEEQTTDIETLQDIGLSQELENYFTVYPNPTDGELLITWEHKVKDLIQSIEIVGYHTPYNRPIGFNNDDLSAEVDLSAEMPSIYIVQFLLKDKKMITKKIIKN